MAELDLPTEFAAASEEWRTEKPSAEFFQRVADQAGVSAPGIAYVGDRLDNDIVPAAAAGDADCLPPAGHVGSHALDLAGGGEGAPESRLAQRTG